MADMLRDSLREEGDSFATPRSLHELCKTQFHEVRMKRDPSARRGVLEASQMVGSNMHVWDLVRESEVVYQQSRDFRAPGSRVAQQ